jgi:hypothetical protein
MPGSSRVPRAAMVGDPFFPAIIAAYGAISKGVKIVKGIQAARKAGHAAPPPMSAMVGMRSPVFGGSSLPIEENTSYIQRAIRGRAAPPGMPAGSRVQVFRAGVAATTGRRRYRRMNVLNIRALKRAIRRAKGFEHIARQVLAPHGVVHHFKKHIRARGKR